MYLIVKVEQMFAHVHTLVTILKKKQHARYIYPRAGIQDGRPCFLFVMRGVAVQRGGCPALCGCSARMSQPCHLMNVAGLQLGVTSHQMRQGQVALVLSMIL